eukprot:TRINITY_DN877_c0_g1_i2.p1 TRINITY_DN877_c0_g1~~TRINITY_DN877_c0_g1_i2.p1  ORF type:complete len:106 (+),score=31.35 TRINITY_DN877_c0_g1_i2:70-387(+)
MDKKKAPYMGKKPTKKVKTDEGDDEKVDLLAGISVNDDNVTIDLNSRKKVCIRKFRKQTLIDIREYWDDKGELKPTKKGISLTTEVWTKLKAHIKDIDEAIANMK